MTTDTPPCRVCSSVEKIICFPDTLTLAICPDCCAKVEHPDGETGHQFEYHKGDGWACRYCGILRNNTDWEP